jgi:drug/metabolite transporter (DMT)-like permease
VVCINFINKKNADFLLLIVAIGWGSTFILVKKAIADLPAFSFLFIRFFLSFLVMYMLFYKKIAIDKQSIIAAFVLGFFNFVAYAFQTIGLYYLPSNIVAFLTGLFVVFTPIIAFFIFKKSISLYAIIGVILSFTGIYFLTSGKIAFSLPIILVIICAISYAFHVNFTDIYSKKYNIFTLVTFQFLAVALFSLIFIPFENRSNIHFSFTVILAIIITVLVATVFAFFVQTFAQKFTTPTRTAVIFAMEPVTASIFGYLYGENLSIKQIIGGLLVILAIIITEAGKDIIKQITKNIN